MLSSNANPYKYDLRKKVMCTKYFINVHLTGYTVSSNYYFLINPVIDLTQDDQEQSSGAGDEATYYLSYPQNCSSQSKQYHISQDKRAFYKRNGSWEMGSFEKAALGRGSPQARYVSAKRLVRCLSVVATQKWNSRFTLRIRNKKFMECE